MIDPIQMFNPVTLAFIATLFTWGTTALGAAIVFATRDFNQRMLESMLGFAGGVMVAASFWSLLSPAVDLSENHELGSWFPAAAGFLLGGFFIWMMTKLWPIFYLNAPMRFTDRFHRRRRKRSALLVLAITLHNIPEGLAIGVAFGALASGGTEAAFSSAIALALGVGIQNIPEGAAVSMPLRGDGFSRKKSFFYGQLSGAAEPVSAVFGALAVTVVEPLLPYALSFAAGAMIFVVIEELIPYSPEKNSHTTAAMSFMIGFAIMMILDVALG